MALVAIPMKTKIAAFISLMFAGTLSASDTYVALSGGYLLDTETEFYGFRIGSVLSSDEVNAHHIEVDILTISAPEDYQGVDLLPIQLNYRFTRKLADTVSLYAGAGAGGVMISRGGSSHSDDWAWALQVFGGAMYHLNAQFSLGGGMRFIHFSDVTSGSQSKDIGNDTGVELFAAYSF